VSRRGEARGGERREDGGAAATSDDTGVGRRRPEAQVAAVPLQGRAELRVRVGWGSIEARSRE
jgi:hypothetical protein